MEKEKKKPKEDKTTPEWLVPILSILTSMGGSYILWVKPLQDSFKIMTEQIENLKREIQELKEKQEENNQASKHQPDKNNLSGSDEDDDELLPIGKSDYIKRTERKGFKASLK